MKTSAKELPTASKFMKNKNSIQPRPRVKKNKIVN